MVIGHTYLYTYIRRYLKLSFSLYLSKVCMRKWSQGSRLCSWNWTQRVLTSLIALTQCQRYMRMRIPAVTVRLCMPVCVCAVIYHVNGWYSWLYSIWLWIETGCVIWGMNDLEKCRADWLIGSLVLYNVRKYSNITCSACETNNNNNSNLYPAHTQRQIQ